MINNFIKNKMIVSILMLSILATSFGGAFASSASAATPDTLSTEESVQDGASKDGGLAAIAVIGLIAALSNHGGSSGNSIPANKNSGSSDNVTSVNKNPVSSSSSGQTSGSTSQTSGSNATSSSSTTNQTSGNSAASEEQQALNLLNKDRAANGLPALKANSQLTQLARNYAQDMINRGFFSHYNPEGQSPFDRMRQAGIGYKYAGENLAINTSVSTAENAFMNSSGHRANILNANYTEVGIGVLHSSNGSVYVVQEFIGR